MVTNDQAKTATQKPARGGLLRINVYYQEEESEKFKWCPMSRTVPVF